MPRRIVNNKKRKVKEIKVVYEYAEGASEEEARRRVRAAFSTLFDLTLAEQKKR